MFLETIIGPSKAVLELVFGRLNTVDHKNSEAYSKDGPFGLFPGKLGFRKSGLWLRVGVMILPSAKLVLSSIDPIQRSKLEYIQGRKCPSVYPGSQVLLRK